jgi:phenylalanine-4-hydroxylase
MKSHLSKASPLPPHLQKYIVEQDYSRYTPEDHAVWRNILRQLRSFMSLNAHSAYTDGIKKCGI